MSADTPPGEEASEFRAVCQTCNEKMPWRESYERARQDREEHEELCWIVTGARDDAITREPDLSYEWRREGE